MVLSVLFCLSYKTSELMTSSEPLNNEIALTLSLSLSLFLFQPSRYLSLPSAILLCSTFLPYPPPYKLVHNGRNVGCEG
jgi:hypothetical protein